MTPPLKIADAVDSLMRDGMPLRFTAYDGSAVGPPDSPVRLELVSPAGSPTSSPPPATWAWPAPT